MKRSGMAETNHQSRNVLPDQQPKVFGCVVPSQDCPRRRTAGVKERRTPRCCVGGRGLVGIAEYQEAVRLSVRTVFCT